MKQQLELKEIVGHLPYGLKCISQVKNLGVETIKGFEIYSSGIELITNIDNLHILECKPILFPISILTEFLREIYQEYNYSLLAIKEMPYATIVTYQLMGETFKDIVYSQGSFNCCPMYVFNKLLEKKLDVYNLIEKGLAIAVTKEFNPYK
jgi:hypothetical protein